MGLKVFKLKRLGKTRESSSLEKLKNFDLITIYGPDFEHDHHVANLAKPSAHNFIKP